MRVRDRVHDIFVYSELIGFIATNIKTRCTTWPK